MKKSLAAASVTLAMLFSGIGVGVSTPAEAASVPSVKWAMPTQVKANTPENTASPANESLADWEKLQAKLAQENPISWLFTGDSITHGANTSEGLRRFSEYFNSYLHSTPINGIGRTNDLVMNTGVANSTTRYLRQAFQQSVLDKGADVVFLALGMNDSVNASAKERVEQNTYRQNLEYFIDQIRASGAIPVLQTQNYPTDGRHASFDTWMQTVREVAAEKKVILLDVQKFWQAEHTPDNSDGWMQADGVHPSAQGYLEWAKFLVKQLNIWNENSTLANTSKAYVERYGSPLTEVPVTQNVPEALNKQPPHQANLVFNHAQTTSESCTPQIKDDEAAQVALFDKQNFTVRFKATSTQTGTLISFADKDSNLQLRLDIAEGGKFKVQRQFKTGNLDGFTLQKPIVADGKFHTVSVNITDGTADYYLDGVKVLPLKGTGVGGANALTLNNFSVDYVTLCAARVGTNPTPESSFSGVLDYAAVSNQVLSEQQIAKQAGAPTVNSVISPFIHNGKGTPNTWVFLGSDTIYGGEGDISAKSATEVFDEVVSWECNGKSCDANPSGLQLAARSRFVVNSSYPGQTTAKMLAAYDSQVKRHKPQVLYLVPDALNPAGQPYETLDSFKSNIKQLVAQAKADGIRVVLVTPAEASAEADQYAAEMLQIAADEEVPAIAAHQYFQKLQAKNTNYSDIVDGQGSLNHKGQLLLGKFLLKESGIPAPNGRRIAALNYYDPAAKLVTPAASSNVDGAAQDPVSCSVKPSGMVKLQEGVRYTVTVNGKEISPQANGAFTYDYGQTLRIKAEAEAGYVIPAGAQTIWSWTAPTREKLDCDKPKPPVVDPSQPGKPGEGETPDPGGNTPKPGTETPKPEASDKPADNPTGNPGKAHPTTPGTPGSMDKSKNRPQPQSSASDVTAGNLARTGASPWGYLFAAALFAGAGVALRFKRL